MGKQSYTYKKVGDCEIKTDVYRIPDDVKRPVIVYIHGGALMMGNRRGPSDQIAMYVGAGYTVVSIDYRLAPETKIKEIIEDVRDAFRWIRNKGSSLFNIDPDRVGVTGGSAGGYLTLMSGFVTDSPPKALVPFYGYGDISGPWYSKPSLFYCQQPLVAEALARGAVGGRVISETGMTPDNRDSFYLYCRQQGLWPKEVTGHDPETEPAAFDPFTPVRNVTERYPPTLLFHGDMDTDVPYELSVMMADKLSEIGIENELVTISGGAHGFDAAGIVDPVVADTFDRALAFFKKYV